MGCFCELGSHHRHEQMSYLLWPKPINAKNNRHSTKGLTLEGGRHVNHVQAILTKLKLFLQTFNLLQKSCSITNIDQACSKISAWFWSLNILQPPQYIYTHIPVKTGAGKDSQCRLGTQGLHYSSRVCSHLSGGAGCWTTSITQSKQVSSAFSETLVSSFPKILL